MAFRMEDLAPNPNYVPPDEKPKKKKVIRKKRKSTTLRAATPKRPLPPSSAQPRDHLGRFASIAGRALWGAARETGRAVARTVKTANKAHKAIKNQQKQARRRQNIELRERAVAVKEREQKLSKKKIVRRKR